MGGGGGGGSVGVWGQIGKDRQGRRLVSQYSLLFRSILNICVSWCVCGFFFSNYACSFLSLRACLGCFCSLICFLLFVLFVLFCLFVSLFA